MAGEAIRSFADPDTEFELVRSDTPVDADGYKLGEPTGEVKCLVCKQSAAAPEYINHLPGCQQSDVTSRWYALNH